MPTSQETLNLLRDFAQSASNAVAGNVSAPVDALAWLLRKGGVPVGDAPVGGSTWMAQHGLTAQPRNRLAALAGETAGMIGPMAAVAKAPQIAAKLLQGADNLSAPRQLSKEAGVFAGHLSKTADVNALAKAKQLQAQGVPDEQIYRQTGWFNGMPDKQWRYEIPDNAIPSKMQLTEDQLFGYPQVSKAYPHTELFKAYPEAADVRLAPQFGKAYDGTFDPSQGTIALKPISGADNVMDAARERKSTAMHELQHFIQQREGFAGGGNVESMPLVLEDMAAAAKADARKYNDLAYSGDPLNPFDLRKPGAKKKSLEAEKKAIEYAAQLARIQQFPSLSFDAYKNLAGEAEARLVQKRINMTPSERASSYPPSMFDVPAEQQIVRFGNALSRK